MFTTVAMLSCIRYGTNRHVWDVPFEDFEYTALMAWLSEVAFLISTCSTKVSVLLFYRRLVQGTFSKRWKWSTIAAIIFTVCYCVAFTLVLVFNCRPTEAYWKALSLTWNKDYQCTNTKMLNPVSGVLSVVSDLYSVILPIGMLRHFETDRRKKIALNAVFALGLLVVAAGAVRTYYLAKLGTNYDITWVGFDVFIWADLEVQLAIICASAPALRVLFRQYLKDPISRAMHTVSSTSRSATRSANRQSKQTETTSTVTYTHGRNSSNLSIKGDKKLIKHSIKPSLDGVAEYEVQSPPSTVPSEQYTIRTPADFEAYALQNLERNRPEARVSTFIRAPSDGDMQSTLSEPFTDW